MKKEEKTRIKAAYGDDDWANANMDAMAETGFFDKEVKNEPPKEQSAYRKR